MRDDILWDDSESSHEDASTSEYGSESKETFEEYSFIIAPCIFIYM